MAALPCGLKWRIWPVGLSVVVRVWQVYGFIYMWISRAAILRVFLYFIVRVFYTSKLKIHVWQVTYVSFVSFQSVNLSYQDLGDPFQRKEFQRVLRRLMRCENLQLIENSLQDLSSVLLPRWATFFSFCTLPFQWNLLTLLWRLKRTGDKFIPRENKTISQLHQW